VVLAASFAPTLANSVDPRLQVTSGDVDEAGHEGVTRTGEIARFQRRCGAPRYVRPVPWTR
jgi:hypothetical protein